MEKDLQYQEKPHRGEEAGVLLDPHEGPESRNLARGREGRATKKAMGIGGKGRKTL